MNQATPATTIELATFYVDHNLLGTDIQQTQEIDRYTDLTPVPHAPPAIRGAINLRGDVVTVVDLGVVLGLRPVTIDRLTRIMIVHDETERLGLLVDRVADVIKVATEDVEPAPANVDALAGRFLRGVCRLEGELLGVLNLPEVIHAMHVGDE
jgi:purine-binding chemotaxis protein CheW